MRFDLQREFELKPSWLVLMVVIGAGTASIDGGFDFWDLLVIAGLAGIFLLVFEGGFWKNNYVILHEAHFDVSRVPWGAAKVYLRPRPWPFKMSIPYASVTDVRIAENGEVEVDVTTEGLSLAKFGQTITVMFRPKDVVAVVNEIQRRVEVGRRI